MGDRSLSELELIERYKKVRVVDVIDALDRYGFHDNVLVSHEIKALYLGIRMAGYAVTVMNMKNMPRTGTQTGLITVIS